MQAKPELGGQTVPKMVPKVSISYWESISPYCVALNYNLLSDYYVTCPAILYICNSKIYSKDYNKGSINDNLRVEVEDRNIRTHVHLKQNNNIIEGIVSSRKRAPDGK